MDDENVKKYCNFDCDYAIQIHFLTFLHENIAEEAVKGIGGECFNFQ